MHLNLKHFVKLLKKHEESLEEPKFPATIPQSLSVIYYKNVLFIITQDCEVSPKKPCAYLNIFTSYRDAFKGYSGLYTKASGLLFSDIKENTRISFPLYSESKIFAFCRESATWHINEKYRYVLMWKAKDQSATKMSFFRFKDVIEHIEKHENAIYEALRAR